MMTGKSGTSPEDKAMLAQMSECRGMVEDRLGGMFDEAGVSYAVLVEAIRYSLLSGGKRIRAVLCMKFCEAAGGMPEEALEAACAIEMMHTYTLIHDDLPAMDGDIMRRGKPANHVEFGEFTAILAGDALQAEAFGMLTGSCQSGEVIAEMVRILSEAAGAYGICGGQYLDLSGEGWQLTIDELIELYLMKTASLISASARLGVLAGSGTEKQMQAAHEYAEAIGLAFQIRDDMLEHISTEEELGKPVSSDTSNNKSTFVSLLGLEACEKMIRKETEKAVKAVEGVFDDTKFLVWLAQNLAERKR